MGLFKGKSTENPMDLYGPRLVFPCNLHFMQKLMELSNILTMVFLGTPMVPLFQLQSQGTEPTLVVLHHTSDGSYGKSVASQKIWVKNPRTRGCMVLIISYN